LKDKLLFIQLRISRSVAFRFKLLNSDFILEIFNSGKRGVTHDVQLNLWWWFYMNTWLLFLWF